MSGTQETQAGTDVLDRDGPRNDNPAEEMARRKAASCLMYAMNTRGHVLSDGTVSLCYVSCFGTPWLSDGYSKT